MKQLGWESIIQLCMSIEDKAMLEQFFDLLFTAEEKESINTRFLIIVALLKQEMSQREIAKTLGVSIAKITRGSNELKRVSGKLKKLLVPECLKTD